MPAKIIEYSRSGNLTEVIKALKLHPDDVHAKDDKGFSSLYWASFHGFDEIAKLLLTSGATIRDNATSDQWSSLIIACSRGHFNIVSLLLEKGADANDRTHLGCTALMVAASKSYVNIMRELLQKGANIHYRGYKGSTAIMVACSTGNLESVRLLLDHGANLNDVNDDKNTSLILAAIKEYQPLVALLLEHKVDIFLRNKEGQNGYEATNNPEIKAMLYNEMIRRDISSAHILSVLLSDHQHYHMEQNIFRKLKYKNHDAWRYMLSFLK